MIGVMNCSSPIVVSGMRRAAAANSSNGMAVATPLKASRTLCETPCPLHVRSFDGSTNSSSAAANGARTTVSAVSPSRALRWPPMRFFMRPYAANDNAREMEIHGGLP